MKEKSQGSHILLWGERDRSPLVSCAACRTEIVGCRVEERINVLDEDQGLMECKEERKTIRYAFILIFNFILLELIFAFKLL